MNEELNKQAALEHTSHRRLNILTGEWVLVSAHRSQRPWQGQQEQAGEQEKLEYDPDCYLCPRNTRVSGCLLYTSPSPRDRQKSRMPSSA